MDIGFCTYCKARTEWKVIDGWLFHRIVRHHRCTACCRAVGRAALEGLLELERQGVKCQNDIALVRHALALDAASSPFKPAVDWSDPPPLMAPVTPIVEAKRTIRPGPGWRA